MTKGYLSWFESKNKMMKKIIIEMQVLNVKWFDKRVLYNLTKTYANQIEEWKHYLKLNPVIALTITDFKMFSEFEKYISHYTFKEKKENTLYNWNLEMVFVELPKFKKSLEELESIQDKWIYFMKEVDDMKVEPENYKKDKVFDKAFNLANRINLSELELDELERESIFIQDRIWMIDFALEKWLKEGEEKGIEKGIEKERKVLIKKLMNSMDLSEKKAKTILWIK